MAAGGGVELECTVYCIAAAEKPRGIDACLYYALCETSAVCLEG